MLTILTVVVAYSRPRETGLRAVSSWNEEGGLSGWKKTLREACGSDIRNRLDYSSSSVACDVESSKISIMNQGIAESLEPNDAEISEANPDLMFLYKKSRNRYAQEPRSEMIWRERVEH